MHAEDLSYESRAESWAECVGEVTLGTADLGCFVLESKSRINKGQAVLQKEQLHGTLELGPPDSKEFANNNHGMQLRHRYHHTSEERLIPYQICPDVHKKA